MSLNISKEIGGLWKIPETIEERKKQPADACALPFASRTALDLPFTRRASSDIPQSSPQV
jgi:hypothetical protein